MARPRTRRSPQCGAIHRARRRRGAAAVMAPGPRPGQLEPPAGRRERPSHGGHPPRGPGRGPPRARTRRRRDRRHGPAASARRWPSRIRSTGIPKAVRVAIEWASKPSSRWANHNAPHSTKKGRPTSSPKSIQAERASRAQRGVERVGAVGRAQDAGLVAGRGPWVAGAEGIDQRRLPAGALGPEGGPGAEGSGADHHDISAGHWTLTRPPSCRALTVSTSAGRPWPRRSPRA